MLSETAPRNQMRKGIALTTPKREGERREGRGRNGMERRVMTKHLLSVYLCHVIAN